MLCPRSTTFLPVPPYSCVVTATTSATRRSAEKSTPAAPGAPSASASFSQRSSSVFVAPCPRRSIATTTHLALFDVRRFISCANRANDNAVYGHPCRQKSTGTVASSSSSSSFGNVESDESPSSRVVGRETYTRKTSFVPRTRTSWHSSKHSRHPTGSQCDRGGGGGGGMSVDSAPIGVGFSSLARRPPRASSTPNPSR
eukprot:31499-Pelagococcus_subviridis.AAC.3